MDDHQPNWQLPASIQADLDHAHQQRLRVVLVTGVFDLLHQEHRHFLAAARQAGDYLIVGVEADARVKQLKGLDRPHDPAEVRIKKILATGLANQVLVLPADFSQPAAHRQLLATIRPAILAVSSHTPHLAEKKLLLQEIGGQVKIVYRYQPGVSTTRLLAQAKKKK